MRARAEGRGTGGAALLASRERPADIAGKAAPTGRARGRAFAVSSSTGATARASSVDIDVTSATMPLSSKAITMNALVDQFGRVERLRLRTTADVVPARVVEGSHRRRRAQQARDLRTGLHAGLDLGQGIRIADMALLDGRSACSQREVPPPTRSPARRVRRAGLARALRHSLRVCAGASWESPPLAEPRQTARVAGACQPARAVYGGDGPSWRSGASGAI